MHDPDDFERKNRRFLIGIVVMGIFALGAIFLIALKKKGRL